MQIISGKGIHSKSGESVIVKVLEGFAQQNPYILKRDGSNTGTFNLDAHNVQKKYKLKELFEICTKECRDDLKGIDYDSLNVLHKFDLCFVHFLYLCLYLQSCFFLFLQD